MKIGEILELTKTMKLSEIAKQYLEVGEKKATEGMKNAGCYSINGKRGWFYDGDPAVLEQSIYDYTTVTFFTKPKANKSNKSNKTTKPATTEIPAKERDNEKPKSTAIRKRMSFDLDTELMKELKIQGIRDDVPLYVMVEKAIRQYLNDQR